VQDFRSYHSICRDIVTRWVYPLVPDAQLLPGSTYAHTKRYTYRESGVRVSRSAVIGDAVVLSRGTLVGDNVQLRRTIVGRDCVIGNNCKITDSHIWKGTMHCFVGSTGCVLVNSGSEVTFEFADVYPETT
jgi:translation initiation factor eIF-2B subunit epsilon